MTKTKGQQTEPLMDAFMRMNFLYQASQLMTTTENSTQLSAYYGLLVKEISKKMVVKIHPDIKRTLCTACSHSLRPEHFSVKIKPSLFKKKKKGKQKFKHPVGNSEALKSDLCKRPKLNNKGKYPNRSLWTCNNCGFTKKYLLNPEFQLWIHKKEAVII